MKTNKDSEFTESIIRDKDWVIIRLKSDNNGKVHCNSQEAWEILAQCIEPMIKETRAKIEERVPVLEAQKYWWFKNFSACNIDTSEVFEEALDIALCVERDVNVDGNLLLIVSAVSKEMPTHDFSRGLYFSSRELVLEYLSTPEVQSELLNVMKELMKMVARMLR